MKGRQCLHSYDVLYVGSRGNISYIVGLKWKRFQLSIELSNDFLVDLINALFVKTFIILDKIFLSEYLVRDCQKNITYHSGDNDTMISQANIAQPFNKSFLI